MRTRRDAPPSPSLSGGGYAIAGVPCNYVVLGVSRKILILHTYIYIVQCFITPALVSYGLFLNIYIYILFSI